MSSSAIGVGLRPTTATNRASPSSGSSTSGSGPSFAIVAATSSGLCSWQAVGPRRSAQVTSVSSRRRTCPTIGGGHSSSASGSPVVCSDIRTCTRARRGAPIEVSEFSPAASSTGSSVTIVPRWLVWPIRPLADAIVGSTRISPAKSHAPYMPRCTRSHRSSSNSRNICLPTARTLSATRPWSSDGALGEAALRARRGHGATDEVAVELPGDAMDGVALGHRGLSLPQGRTSCRSRRGRRAVPMVARGSGSSVPSASNAASCRMRRTCRSSPENGVAMKVSMNSVTCSKVC